MRIRRPFPIIIAVLIVAAGIALLVVLRKHAPPEAARLLPGADGFLYVNLQWMRRANILEELPSVPHDHDYEEFIQATGIDFEKDLNEAAFSVHFPHAGDKPPQPRFSEIFVGKIHAQQLRSYLAKVASIEENYRSLEIYSIPLEGRTVRVTILDPETVAASNVDDPQVIRGIVERSRKLASPFGGPALLRQYYKHVPLASLGWAIVHVDPAADFFKTAPGPWLALLSQSAVLMASVRYIRELHLRGVAFTGSEAEAENISDRAQTYLTLFRAAEVSSGPLPQDPDVKALFDSLKVQQEGKRAIVTAIMPVGFIRKAVEEAPESVVPEPTPKQPAKSATTPPKRRKATPVH